MAPLKRVFILGAGFSKPAGMPLATELLSSLSEKLDDEEMREWFDGLAERLAWLSNSNKSTNPLSLNIEQVFHIAHFDIETHRLRQHLSPVGRNDGPSTPWNESRDIKRWLSNLEDALCDIILEKDDLANLDPIIRWAENIHSDDTVITFNYDTLVERAFTELGKSWNHGTRQEKETGIKVCKMHGSIGWIVAHRSESFFKLDLLFEKTNVNRSESNTGHVEDDCRLWRCQERTQLKEWLTGRDLQLIPEDASPRKVGIAGLGAYKQLHEIPGLGRVWVNGMKALYEADHGVVIGFSMSDFDTMAQIQFAEVARKRKEENRRLHVTVIDPFINEAVKERFQRVFREVDFVCKHHESVDWNNI